MEVRIADVEHLILEPKGTVEFYSEKQTIQILLNLINIHGCERIVQLVNQIQEIKNG